MIIYLLVDNLYKIDIKWEIELFNNLFEVMVYEEYDYININININIYIYIYIISLVRVWLVLSLNFVLLYLIVDFIALYSF